MFKKSGHKADVGQIVKSQNIGVFIYVLTIG